MIIKSLELSNFRNYESLHLDFSEGTNIFYGDNAQGKTNILESLYMISTTKSHRGVKDRDLIRFGQEEAHIRTVLIKNDLDYQVDMHLRKNKTKGIAINGQRIRKASDQGNRHQRTEDPQGFRTDRTTTYRFLFS